MPTILRIGPYRFYFFSNEGDEPSHVHVDRDAATAKVWLDPVELSRSRGFRPKEIGVITGIVTQHAPALLEAWHDYFGTAD